MKTDEETDRQIVIDELRKIASRNHGVLLPEKVVQAAQSASSPLHNHFQWDDSEAAHQYRLWQAREMINVQVEYTKVKGEMVQHRVFVSMSTDRQKGGGYRELIKSVKIKEYRQQILEDAFEELQIFRRKYESLKELADVFKAIDNITQ